MKVYKRAYGLGGLLHLFKTQFLTEEWKLSNYPPESVTEKIVC